MNGDIFFDSLITVSGIISAILVAYLANKIFEERSNRLTRKNKIKKLFSKITSFRKIAYYISISGSLWPHYNDIMEFKIKHQEMTYWDFHNQNDESGQYLEFEDNNMPYHKSSIDFYLALKEIIGSSKQPVWAFNPIHEEEYTLKVVENISYPSNQLGYYIMLKDMKDILVDVDSWVYEDSFHKELKNIGEEYIPIDNIATLFANLGSDFNRKYLPKVYGLMKKNAESLPIHVRLLVNILLLIIIFGIILPLLFFWIKNPVASDLILLLSTSFSISCIISLFIVLKLFIREEVQFEKYT